MGKLGAASSRAVNIRSALSVRRGNTKEKSFTKSPCVNKLKGNFKNIDLKFNFLCWKRAIVSYFCVVLQPKRVSLRA